MTPLAKSGLKLSAPRERGNNLISALTHQDIAVCPHNKGPRGLQIQRTFLLCYLDAARCVSARFRREQRVAARARVITVNRSLVRDGGGKAFDRISQGRRSAREVEDRSSCLLDIMRAPWPFFGGA